MDRLSKLLLLTVLILVGCGEQPKKGEHYDVNKPYIEAEKKAKSTLEQANKTAKAQLDSVENTQGTPKQNADKE